MEQWLIEAIDARAARLGVGSRFMSSSPSSAAKPQAGRVHYEVEVQDYATWQPFDGEEFSTVRAAEAHKADSAMADRMRVVEVVSGRREPIE